MRGRARRCIGARAQCLPGDAGARVAGRSRDADERPLRSAGGVAAIRGSRSGPRLSPCRGRRWPAAVSRPEPAAAQNALGPSPGRPAQRPLAPPRPCRGRPLGRARDHGGLVASCASRARPPRARPGSRAGPARTGLWAVWSRAPCSASLCLAPCSASLYLRRPPRGTACAACFGRSGLWRLQRSLRPSPRSLERSAPSWT